MRIATLVIYQVVTLYGRNISRVEGSGLCSKVSGILNFPAPLTESPVHPKLRAISGGEAALVTSQELCRWFNGQHSIHSAESPVSAGALSVSQQPDAAIRQQFLLGLLEDCGFFAHLVLRCVRGGNGSLDDVAAPCAIGPRLDSGVELGTRRITHIYAQRELKSQPAGWTETSFPESERLWVEMASRQVCISVREGERP